jgi:hypothetical protein
MNQRELVLYLKDIYICCYIEINTFNHPLYEEKKLCYYRTTPNRLYGGLFFRKR